MTTMGSRLRGNDSIYTKFWDDKFYIALSSARAQARQLNYSYGFLFALN